MLYLIEILHQTTTLRIHTRVEGGCILSKFYIKPQPLCKNSFQFLSCILSKFYIKPQLKIVHRLQSCVVSYRNSTSNHNNPRYLPNRKNVVSYRNSTSNHNKERLLVITRRVVSYRNSTSNHNSRYSDWLETFVVSYRNSTSNHNTSILRLLLIMLYLIEILHQTTTKDSSQDRPLRCILSKFYIKPQLRRWYQRYYVVVSYRNSTSNHNEKNLEA